MKRTTIFIEEPVERDLKALAERDGRSTASVVREALSDYVLKRRLRGRLSFVAAGSSGLADGAERQEELLWGDPHGEQPSDD